MVLCYRVNIPPIKPAKPPALPPDDAAVPFEDDDGLRRPVALKSPEGDFKSDRPRVQSLCPPRHKRKRGGFI
jgi:hypothetical protein